MPVFRVIIHGATEEEVKEEGKIDVPLSTVGIDILDKAEGEFASVKALINPCLYATTIAKVNGDDTTVKHELVSMKQTLNDYLTSISKEFDDNSLALHVWDWDDYMAKYPSEDDESFDSESDQTDEETDNDDDDDDGRDEGDRGAHTPDRRDRGGYGGDGGAGQGEEAPSSSTSVALRLPEGFEQEVLNTDLSELSSIEKALKSEVDMLLLKMKTVRKQKKSLEKTMKKEERVATSEMKKLQIKEEKKSTREASITLNFKTDKGMQAVTLMAKDTIADLRSAIGTKFPTVTKKDIKAMSLFRSGDTVDLNKTPRKSLLGAGVKDGDIITIQWGLRGGGKRGSSVTSSKEERLENKTSEAKVLLLQLSTMESFDIKNSYDILNKMLDNISETTFDDATKKISLKELQKFQASIQGSNNESTRLDLTMRLLADNMVKEISKKEKTLKCLFATVKALTSIAVFKKFMGDNGRINWETMRAKVEEEIIRKASSQGAGN